MVVTILWAVGALAASAFASNISPMYGGETSRADIAVKVRDLNDAVASPMVRDDRVYEMARNLFDRVPDASIKVEIQLRGWDRETVPQKGPATVERMIDSSGKRLDQWDVPAPELAATHGEARSMHASRRMSFDESLPDNEMGVYRYNSRTSETGSIGLNEWLAAIAPEIGDPFTFSTGFHEAGHRLFRKRGKLNPLEVIRGEMFSYWLESLWVRGLDPHGEKLVFLQARADNAFKSEPSKLNSMVLAYVNHLIEVWGTNGDEEKLEALVRRRGYEDGHEHREDHDHPVRN